MSADPSSVPATTAAPASAQPAVLEGDLTRIGVHGFAEAPLSTDPTAAPLEHAVNGSNGHSAPTDAQTGGNASAAVAHAVSPAVPDVAVANAGADNVVHIQLDVAQAPLGPSPTLIGGVPSLGALPVTRVDARPISVPPPAKVDVRGGPTRQLLELPTLAGVASLPETLSTSAVELVSEAGNRREELMSVPDSAPLELPMLDGFERQPTTKVTPGTRIADRYEVTDVLGEGGMGIVYRCIDTMTRDYVALKRVIPPEGKLANDYILWFYKEARALAALGHPNIVRARDFGVLVDGSPFLAMDLVDGVSLHELLAAPMPFWLVWSIVDQTLAALAHAHARGVVHGDLKPSNVIVEERAGRPPRVHVLDFGLAWLREETHDERLDGAKAMEFAPHAGAGTPGYMAPEQILHEMHHVCGATDLYSLGCALYKMLSGGPPFTGDSKELLRLHAYEQLPAVKLVIDAPKGVAGFVHRLLAKKPWDRWEFAAEARREWARFHPGVLAPEAYRLPSVARRGLATDGAPTLRPGRTTLRELPTLPDRAPGLLSIRQSPLVGREDVRLLLRRICNEVINAQGAPHRLVILVGPAGVGKSRIAQWLCESIHEDGRMVPLRSRYRPMRSPIDGMLGAVTQYLNFERSDHDTIERSLMARWGITSRDKNGRAWVAGAAEWLRPTPPGVEKPLGPSGMRFTLDTLETRRLAIRYTLRRISRGRPLLFWLDDLHHAGSATFEGLLRIHEEEPDQRIVMVATVRSEDVQLNHRAAERLRRLRESLGGDVVEVHPLDADTTAKLVRESLPLDDAAVKEASRRSRGNPLFALQQLHAWAVSGHLRLAGGAYHVPQDALAVRPRTTADLWDSRITAIKPEHQLAAFAAATLGADIRRNVLASLLRSLGLPVAEALLALQSAEVILPRGPGRYSWPHALLQEHLLTRLAERGDAASVYRAAADALTRHPLSNTRRVVRQRVMNLLHADEADGAAKVLFEFIAGSWNGAREPLATLSDLELLKGRLQGRLRAIRHRWQAEALRHVGRPEDAESRARIAQESFTQLGDTEELAHTKRLLAHLASERGSSQEGLALATEAIELFRAVGNLLGQAQCEAVIGEIHYLLGDYERSRQVVESAEAHFAALNQPLGRGQCLLLHGWIDHSEGSTERSRRHTLDARAEFERAGYRLGTAQADASLAHIEHRLMNYSNAERGAQDALSAFETLRTLRGQAACERLLAMVGIDTDDVDMAELHAERAFKIYERMGDPWGIVETRLLLAQASLSRHRPEPARAELEACSTVHVEEAEPRQHMLITRAWCEYESGNVDAAYEALELASDVFSQRARVGDHAPHLLARLSRLNWPSHAKDRIDAWLALLTDRAKRTAE